MGEVEVSETEEMDKDELLEEEECCRQTAEASPPSPFPFVSIQNSSVSAALSASVWGVRSRGGAYI